ncbi:hypothetical protein BH09VER1_BH09VER1_15930 [soil metagenome]
MIVRALVILAVAALVFGSSAYFAYDLYWKPRELDEQDKKVQAQIALQGPIVPPDPGSPAYEKALAARKNGDVVGARQQLLDFLQNFPDSTRVAEAKALLGEINSNAVFSTTPSPDKTVYTVGRGDALAKIAGKTKSSAELIFRVNNLESINLQVGQKLLVPQLDTSLAINRKAHTITLFNKGQFFKEYHLLSLKMPSTPPGGKAKVQDKFALHGTTRVAFGSKEYSGAERAVLLPGGLVLRGVPDGTPGPYPAGLVVSNSDIGEIFLLVSRGTPVTIN